MVSSRPVVAATEIIGLMRGQSFGFAAEGSKKLVSRSYYNASESGSSEAMRSHENFDQRPADLRELVGERDFTPHSRFRTRRVRWFFPPLDSTIVISVRFPASGGRDRT